MREELSPRKKVCLLWNWGKHSPFRFQLFTAETVTISIMIYLEKIKTIFRIELTFFQNHYTASGSPVDPILPKFSLFVPFNRVNLWYFVMFFNFHFSDSYFMFKLPCMVRIKISLLNKILRFFSICAVLKPNFSVYWKGALRMGVQPVHSRKVWKNVPQRWLLALKYLNFYAYNFAQYLN